jgi:hypothetical protein
MIQSLHFQRVRTPALALGALALIAVGATTLPHLSGNNATAETIVVQVPSTSLAQRPLVTPVQPDSTACGAGAYVSGDLAGDASPAAIYTSMCGR